MRADGGVGERGSSESALVWCCAAFESLDVFTLQRIHIARQQVFVVEQACPFLDADEWDEGAWHLTAAESETGSLRAYARLLAPGTKYREASIGRVLTTSFARGSGLGRELVARAINAASAEWPGADIRIGAQARLEVFYASFGFRTEGDPYMEDGISHLEMLKVG